VRQLQEQAIRQLRKNMNKFEKQRTWEEIQEEKRIEERTKMLQDLLHKSA
jgi:hypothetical protein